MINSILIDQKLKCFSELESKINLLCPNVCMCGHSNSIDNASVLIKENNPDLIFLGLENSIAFRNQLFEQLDCVDFETIIISQSEYLAKEALKCNAIGFLSFPIQTEELLIAIHNAQVRIEQKKEREKEKRLLNKFLLLSSSEEVIGVPTMEGFEFLQIRNIIRCEGLQKCTRIFTKDNTNIVSSYNLGEFRKLLEKYGFYSPHKSYLINLKLIQKYYKEGSIKMIDGVSVPVAKRRKSDFLKQINHI